MSFQPAVAKLSTPVKELVLAVTENGIRHIGESAEDQADVTEWIEQAVTPDFVSEANLQSLNTLVTPRTYLVSNYLTAADVAIYGALHPTFSKFQPPQYYAHPSLTRYFDHIQSSSPVRRYADSLTPAFNLIPFDLDNAPKLERKADAPKKKEKKPAVGKQAATVEGVPAEEVVPSPAQKKEKKKEKKNDVVDESSKKKAAGGGKAVPVDDGDPRPSMIDLRVGHIVDVMKHPDADGLYVEQIDIGEETGPRTVVSGLVNYIPIEEMRDKYLVAVCNLKPANMRGIKSFAMVLAATSKEGKEGGVELIQPPPNSKPGDRVYFEGSEFENDIPLAQLNPKKKIFEAIQPGFITLDTREAAWINAATKSVHKIRTKDGICLAPTLVGASLS
ncbi:nucleic acid-binding protein [Tricholoma matsutake]|nr:nucleic acid-binding protein [Tricholoma matsutake 945]